MLRGDIAGIGNRFYFYCLFGLAPGPNDTYSSARRAIRATEMPSPESLNLEVVPPFSIHHTRSNGKDRPPPKAFPNGKKPYSTSALLDLRINYKLSYQAIADMYGKSVSTVYEKLRPFLTLDDGEQIDAFQLHKGKILNGAVLRALTLAFDPERVKKASSGNFFYGARQIYEMSRLESDLSTSNIALHTIVEQIEQEERARRGKPPAVEGSTDGE